MKLKKFLTSFAIILLAGSAQAEDSSITLGKSAFKNHCALCHGEDGKGHGEIAELFKVPPSDLTKISERAGGVFPTSDINHILVNGMEKRGHGDAKMPVWGDFFLADSLADRGVRADDAVYIASGRIWSLVYYLESIQE